MKRMPHQVLVAIGALMVVSASAESPIVANPERMEQRILTLGEFGANPEGGVSRIAFSDADLAAREYVKGETFLPDEMILSLNWSRRPCSRPRR